MGKFSRKLSRNLKKCKLKKGRKNLSAGYTLMAKYVKMGAKCEKQKVYSGVLYVTFFTFDNPFFAFRISQQGRHSHENLKDFAVYFFAALIKHEIRLKCEKCKVSVPYFAVCFAKYPRNAKSEKRIASLTKIWANLNCNFIEILRKSLKKFWEICKKLDKMSISGWGIVQKIQGKLEKSIIFE